MWIGPWLAARLRATSARRGSRAASGAAQSPWSLELNRTGIKVDPYIDTVAHAFQSQELTDGTCWIEVLGVWNDLGACREGLSVEPGQYCTRAGTTEQFRVYAVDELIASDTRDRFPDGYAVLFSDPVAIDDQDVPVGDLVARPGPGHIWALGFADGEGGTGVDATPVAPDEQDDSIDSDIDGGDVARTGRQSEPIDDEGIMTPLLPDGRIVARLLADGRIEFGFQPEGGDRILPRSRYFPANARVDRWLRSSLIELE